MKSTDVGIVKQLTHKLEAQGDIALEESDWIYSLEVPRKSFPFKKDELEYIAALIDALSSWYRVVAKKIEAGQRGNFIFTVRFNNGSHNKYMYPAQKALRERQNLEDLCNIVMIDEKLSLPPALKRLFKEATAPSFTQDDKIADWKDFYEMNNFRAGIYYYPVETNSGYCTLSQFMEKFFPVMKTTEPGFMMHVFFEKVFEVALGARKLAQNSTILGRREIESYVLATFMRDNNIPCAFASSTFAGKSVIFAEEKNRPVVKKASEVSLNELVKNALSKNIIDQKMAKELLNNDPVSRFPTMNFITASVEYLNEKVTRKLLQEKTEEEPDWIEETR